MTSALHARDRAVLRLSGPDTRPFLQGLVTNDVARLDTAPVYAALLSPQGKYLFDFLLLPDGADVLIDVSADRAAALAQRLGLYRLRAAVTVAATDLGVVLGFGPAPAGAFADPRDAALGWRTVTEDPEAMAGRFDPLDRADYERQRVTRAVPQSGIELVPEDSYILEAGFERLNGVDFRKGCYVGQEVTARMKHKTELKKGLVPVRVTGEAPPPGTEILAGDRPAGRLFSVAGDRGLAHLRFDRAAGTLTAGAAGITRIEASG
jgi:folate-binding protein YgfZ